MMDLSASMATLGARQLGAALGETLSQQALGAALRLLQQSAEVARAAVPGEAGREWRELANKLAAFELFQQAPALLGAAPLSEQLRRAAAQGPYRAVWLTEGLGYAHAESAVRSADLPANVVVPLHTGAALAFAGRLLATDERPDLAGWIARWQATACPGYGCLAVEALGLVARNLYPHLLPQLAGRLRALDPALAESFWHGAGRGLYFVPTHAVPYSGALERAFEKARREPPDEAGRQNALAGLAWALTLVNLRDPEILAGALWRHWRHGGERGSAAALANGVSSAVLVWYDVVGLDPHLAAFLGFRPGSPALAALWRDLVLGPCEEALQITYPQLRQSGGLAPLFRFQPPPRKGVSGP